MCLDQIFYFDLMKQLDSHVLNKTNHHHFNHHLHICKQKHKKMVVLSLFFFLSLKRQYLFGNVLFCITFAFEIFSSLTTSVDFSGPLTVNYSLKKKLHFYLLFII